MAVLQDLGLVIFRISTILPLLLAVTLFMGKRSIGALPVFDFLVIMTLASVTGADIANPDIQHIHTVAAIIGIALLQRFSAGMMMRSRRFGRLVTFEPTIVVHNGKFLAGNLRKVRYTVDNVLQMLREKNIFDVTDVDLAIIEGNGSLTVHPRSDKTPVTAEDLDIKKKSEGIAYPVILEGRVYTDVLTDLGLDYSWLVRELGRNGIPSTSEVFYAGITRDKKLHYSKVRERKEGPPFYL
ncbi:DUF421 domain-containing protein [Alteribacter lacisalsi]|uniref:DUF421 domain-containing protein n=1 Tax=Alteribacter lacisalsi TaxID=2045244 RepID=UPI001F2366D1|nr:DUF421 domain-containing protein [Alteribacter lacisalsi]